jgi:hypothetical protein
MHCEPFVGPLITRRQGPAPPRSRMRLSTMGACANVTADAITTMTTGSEVGVGLHRFGRWVPAMTPKKQAKLPTVEVEEADGEWITARMGPWCSSDPSREVVDWEVKADLDDMPALGVSALRVGQVHRGDDVVTMAASGQRVQSEPGGHATPAVARWNGAPPPRHTGSRRTSHRWRVCNAPRHHRRRRASVVATVPSVNVGHRSSRAPALDARRAGQYLRRSAIGPDPGGVHGSLVPSCWAVSMQPRAAASGSEQSPSSEADLRRPHA